MYHGRLVFAQLTYRESLKAIEICLHARKTKPYHLSIRGDIVHSTLADANEIRDWSAFRDFAMRLIEMTRALYANDSLGVDLDSTIYALDTITIDLCLPVLLSVKLS